MLSLVNKKSKKPKKKKSKEAEMSFMDHLEELRWHLFRSVIAIISVGIIVFVFRDWVFNNIIYAPKFENFFTYKIFCGISEAMCFTPPQFDIKPIEMGEQFFTAIKVSFWLGLIVSFPYVFWEFWRFIKPGLYKKEQKAARGIVLICSLLFIIGVCFGYFLIAPFAIKFLLSFNVGTEAVTAPTLSSYVSYMTMFTFPTGIAFELPIVAYFLSIIGMLHPDFMRKYRKHAFIIILMIAAIITPPDAVTQVLIGIPIFFLYEVSIIISARVNKRREKENATS